MDISIVALLCLITTFITLWVKKTAWLWAPLLMITLYLLIDIKVMTPLALMIIIFLFLVFLLLRTLPLSLTRDCLVLITTALAFAIRFNWIPVFNAFPHFELLNFNLGSPFLALFPLIFLIPLCQTKEDWLKVSAKGIVLSFIALFLWVSLGLFSNILEWELKISPNLILHIIGAVLGIVIPEESFFRGFLQRELSQRWGLGWLGKTASILICASLSTGFHLTFQASFAALLMTFIASLIYGFLYQITKSIEVCLASHLGQILLQLFFLSYIHP